MDDPAMLLAEQERLELRALDMGVARYRTERSDASRSAGWPEQRMIVDALRTLVPAVHRLQRHVAAGHPARGVSMWGAPILSLPADKLGFLTLAAMVDNANMGDHSRMLDTARKVGTMVKIEREFALIKRDAPDVYQFIRRHSKNWTRRAHRAARMKAQGVDTGWSLRTTYWIGMVLVEQAVQHTSLFEVERYIRNGRTVVRVNLRKEAYDAIEAAHRESELLRPFYLPMVVPPRDWGGNEQGGYLHHRCPLVKPNSEGSWKAGGSGGVEIPDVVEAVNAIQQTKWRINTRVLEVLEQLWKGGGGWAKLPTSEPDDVPPPEFNWDTATDDQRREWKLQATRIHDENARLGSQRKSVTHKLWIAAQLSGRDVYFPHQLDWRGRAYPVPSHLHPQSDDVGRALLEFSQPRELGERGLRWLMIHLANCFGRSRESFHDRVQWCVSNAQHIERSASNPFDHRWWSMAKKPWQALAACFELSMAQASPTYGSRLPVQVDGSCNGLQHFSAMGRDATGARLVNLLPGSAPQSVYEVIAERVDELVRRDMTKPGWWRAPTDKREGVAWRQIASTWDRTVTADVVKRPTMTIVYGLTHAGMMKQYIEDGWCDEMPGGVVDNAAYLRDVTWEALDGALSGAAAIMGWLRRVAEIASDQNQPLRWWTPDGFPVVQEYLEQRETHLYTAMQKLTIRQPRRQRRISKHRQVRGVPPNLVHSFDAAHMRATVLNCKRRGIDAFSMIHDSFGVHAACVDGLQAALREEFVRMYSEPVLQTLKRGWEQQLGRELPPLPPQGVLDLGQILQSEYMFS